MNNEQVEPIWFCSIVSDPMYIESAKAGFFKDKRHQEAFKIVKSFWKKYSEIPTPTQVKGAIKMLGLSEQLPESQIDALFSYNLQDYDTQWLRENTEAWIEWKNLEQSALDSISYIKSTKVDVDNIKDVVNTFKSIIVDRNNLDFSFNLGLDFTDPDAHKQPKNSTFSSGYDFIDLALGGGWSAKSLYVLLGSPKSGKCSTGSAQIRNTFDNRIYNIKLEEFFNLIKQNKYGM